MGIRWLLAVCGLLLCVQCGDDDNSETTDTGTSDLAPDLKGADPAPGPDIDAILILRGDELISGCISAQLDENTGPLQGNQHTNLEAGTLDVGENKDFPENPLPLAGFVSLGGGYLTCETQPFRGGDTVWVVELGPEREPYSVFIAEGPTPAWYPLIPKTWKGSQKATIVASDTATFNMVQVLDLSN